MGKLAQRGVAAATGLFGLWQTDDLGLTPSPSDPLLGEILRRLVDAYRPDRIYLFGSTARGDAGPDSDYDLLIVVPEDSPASRKGPDLGYLAVEGLPRSGDFLVWTRERFESRLHLRASLPSTVLREGKLLYEA